MPKCTRRNHTAGLLGLESGEYYERTTTGDTRRLVNARIPFVAGKETIYGRWEWGYDDTNPDPILPMPNQAHTPTNAKRLRYVVYSYGSHFPMYIWDEVTQRWYGNRDKYSITTTRHQRHACPGYSYHDNPSIQWLDTDKMIAIARHGVFATVCHAAAGGRMIRASIGLR